VVSTVPQHCGGSGQYTWAAALQLLVLLVSLCCHCRISGCRAAGRLWCQRSHSVGSQGHHTWAAALQLLVLLVGACCCCSV
jgi:hypothetical protein